MLIMLRILLVLWYVYALFYYVAAQSETGGKSNQSVNVVVTEVTTNTTNPTSDSVVNVDCQCVPYYLCNPTYDYRKVRSNTCSDYLEVCCDVGNIVNQPVTLKPNTSKLRNCGVRNAEGVGFQTVSGNDNETQFGEFPWMIALLQKQLKQDNKNIIYKYQCGASLIHPQVVLTAAHCISDKNHQYKIRAGEWDTQTDNEIYAHQERDVKTILIHPQYYTRGVFYDYALLILDSPLEITENVNVICLPNKNVSLDNLLCYTTGWGKEIFGIEGRYQNILKKVELPIVNRHKCEEQLRTTRLGSRFKLHETYVCAGGYGIDTCKGDGGAALVCPISKEENRYFQAGILAWSIGCSRNSIPAAYADVTKVLDWIDTEMVFNNFDTEFYRY